MTSQCGKLGRLAARPNHADRVEAFHVFLGDDQAVETEASMFVNASVLRPGYLIRRICLVHASSFVDTRDRLSKGARRCSGWAADSEG